MKHDPERILEYIVAYKQAHDGNSPTVREIGAACGIPSTSNVLFVVKNLEEEGRIRVHGVRQIEVFGGKWSVA